MRSVAIMTAAALFGASACATAQADGAEISERAAERLAGFDATGETRTCLSTAQIRTIEALDARHFLVEVRGGQYYLNKTTGRCSGAGRGGNRLQYAISNSQLCRNQIIRVVDNSDGFTVGSCGLGSFETLEEIPDDEAADE